MKRIRNTAIAALALCLFGIVSTIVHAQENRYVRIINHASASIRYLYASNVDRDDWQEDLLGPFRVLTPNHYIDANIDDGTGHCLYDIKAVLSDRRVAITRGLNVCTNGSWTVTDEW
jgi:hypothetical protein